MSQHDRVVRMGSCFVHGVLHSSVQIFTAISSNEVVCVPFAGRVEEGSGLGCDKRGRRSHANKSHTNRAARYHRVCWEDETPRIIGRLPLDEVATDRPKRGVPRIFEH